MNLSFPNPEGPRAVAVSETLETLGLATSTQIGHVVCPESFGKGMPQSTQRLLKTLVERRVIKHTPAWRHMPFEHLRRFVYTLNGRSPPLVSGAHQLLTNDIRIPLMLMQRCKKAPLKVLDHAAYYETVSTEKGPQPATRLRLPDGALDPDVVAHVALPKGKQIMLLCEADMGTEPIVAWNAGPMGKLMDPEAYDAAAAHLDPSSILRKVIQAMRFVNEDYHPKSSIVAYQSLWVFLSKRRLEQVHVRLLQHLPPKHFIWMSHREAIENPVDFWLAPVWQSLIPDPKPFALIANNKMTYNPIE